MTSSAVSSGVFAAAQLDITKPLRTRDGRRVVNLRQQGTYVGFSIEGETGLPMHSKYLGNGRSYLDPAGRDLPDDLVNIVEDVAYTRRSIRQGKHYVLRDGRPVEIISWDSDDSRPIVAMFELNETEKRRFPGRTKMVFEYHKSGRIEPNGKDHPQDIVEVNQTVVKWVRVYDAKPLTESGKQKFNGKEINSAIAAHWYIFDTELEARANLQGVRAVFRIEYVEGEGVA